MPFKKHNPGCPCCGGTTPPLPECSCPASPCFPPGKGQPSGLKVEIEFQDAFTIVEINREQFTSGACNGKWITYTRTKSVSGVSGFNGTYDIGYYKWTGSEYVSANPSTEPCGYWFYPVIETELTVFDQLVIELQDNCMAGGGTQTFADGVVTSHIVVNPINSFVNQISPTYQTHPGVRIAKNLGTGLTPPLMTLTDTKTQYSCIGGSPIVTNSNATIPASNPTFLTGTGLLETLVRPPAVGLRGRIINFSSLMELNGQYGRLYQYAKDGASMTPCEILPEEGTIVLNAYSYSVTPTRREYSINFGSYQCRTKVLLNV